MNTRSVSIRAWRKPGILSTLLTGLLMLCSACSAQQQASKIYVLSATRGCKVTTYTMDGKQIDPEIPIGGFTCNGMVMDSDGNLLVSIRDRGVMKYDPSGRGKIFIANTGASSIAIDAAQNVYLLIPKDMDNWLIREYRPSGAGVAWPMTINLNNVSGIALNKSGRLFAISQGNAVVRMWEPDGRLLVQAIKTGDTPRAIAVGPDGKLFFANYMSVTSFVPDGKTPLWPPLKHANPLVGGIDNPTALYVDEQGWLYIGYNSGYVGMISPEGKPKGDAFMAREDIRAIVAR
jgi:streptogramin lyase